MTGNHTTSISETRQQITRLYVAELINKAREQVIGFTLKPEDVFVRFDLRGTTAGQGGYFSDEQGFGVKFNLHLLNENWQDYLDETIAHEVAHVVVTAQYKHSNGRRPKPHGREWQMVMRNVFNTEPQRTHDYDVAACRVRTVKRYKYKCSCRTHMLTSIRHNRILRGEQVYHCRSCKGTLTLV